MQFIKIVSNKLLPKHSSIRSIVKLMLANAGGQAVWLAATPIITRLYSPSNFGILASFLTLLTLINAISSLRYELAIVVPEQDDEAISLVWLSGLFVFVTASLTLVVTTIFSEDISCWVKTPLLESYLWILPAGVFFLGLYQIGNFWAIRLKQFDVLAKTKFWQSVFGVFINFLSFPFGAGGLILGQIVNQSSGFPFLFKKSPHVFTNWKQRVLKLRKIFWKYYQFGLYSSPAGLLNVAGSQIPNLLFLYYYGTNELGQLAFSQKLTVVPASMIAASIGKVFLSHAAEKNRDNKLLLTVQKTCFRLFVIGILYALIIATTLVPCIGVIFGAPWAECSYIILYLMPLLIIEFTVAPISGSFVASEKMLMALVAQGVLCCFRLIPLILFLPNATFAEGVLLYSTSSTTGFLLYLGILILTISPKQRSDSK